jgi:hypothetical protein
MNYLAHLAAQDHALAEAAKAAQPVDAKSEATPDAPAVISR